MDNAVPSIGGAAHSVLRHNQLEWLQKHGACGPPRLSPEQIHSVREIFELLDEDNSGERSDSTCSHACPRFRAGDSNFRQGSQVAKFRPKSNFPG
jgi:hypothetical protein